jgi:predicted DCC family thiol-disulfide oxidoreductase YuxK
MSGDGRPDPLHGPHLLLYDGVCGLCNRLIQAVLAWDRSGIVHFAALQSEVGSRYLAKAGGPHDMTTFVLIPGYRHARHAVLTKSDAAIFLIQSLGWPWRTAAVARLLPRPWRDRIYDFVARHRYVFGRVNRCAVPSPHHRPRFLDLKSDPAP